MHIGGGHSASSRDRLLFLLMVLLISYFPPFFYGSTLITSDFLDFSSLVNDNLRKRTWLGGRICVAHGEEERSFRELFLLISLVWSLWLDNDRRISPGGGDRQECHNSFLSGFWSSDK